MATLTYELRAKVNHGRMNAMMQDLHARVKRARRRDRPAIIDRGIRAITNACVRIKGA